MSRAKRSVEEEEKVDLRRLDHDAITKEKAAIVDCQCEWGLFRDRNVTLRKSVTINHGMNNLDKKGTYHTSTRSLCHLPFIVTNTN